MKAMLVMASFMTRVVVEDNATEEEIILSAHDNFRDVINNGTIGDNIESIEIDDECPYNEEED